MACILYDMNTGVKERKPFHIHLSTRSCLSCLFHPSSSTTAANSFGASFL